MKKKFLQFIVFLMLVAMLLSLTAFAIPGLIVSNDDRICLDSEYNMSRGDATVMSISNPTRATLIVGTTSYAAPNPSTGYAQEVLPANTVIWVVEKVKYSGNNKYYYYAGYAYNGGSHRGYFCEDNVYVNGSRLLPANVTAETNDAKLKAYTSLAGTVYDGPGTSYASAGSIGQISVKLIRTENNYNLIEYTASGKTRRGYLLYSLVKDVWSNLSANNASVLNGKTFYLKNASSGLYVQTIDDNPAAGSRIIENDFNGDIKQIFKFQYDSAGKFFYIQPVSGYANNRRLSMNTSQTTHPDRQLQLAAQSNVLNQKFWIINVGTNLYKILPLYGYGTMSLTAKIGYINQWYTQSGTTTTDTWLFETTERNTGVSRVTQDLPNYCWLATAECLASAEEGFNAFAQSDVCYAVKGSYGDQTGTEVECAKAATYFITQNLSPLKFEGNYGIRYNEYGLRKYIYDGHPVGVSMANENFAHLISVAAYKWVDKQGQTGSPGYYVYGYFDSETYANASDNTVLKWKTYDVMTTDTRFFTDVNQEVQWSHTVSFIY